MRLSLDLGLGSVATLNAGGGVVPEPVDPGIAWTPAMLGSNLKLWLDAFDTSSVTSSAGAVSQWSDKSGGARHATQATAARQPTLGETSLNGTPLICFNDSLTTSANDALVTPATVLAAGTAHHIFWFGRLRAANGNNALLLGTGNFSGPLFQRFGAGDNTVRAYNTTGPVLETDGSERLRMFQLDYRTTALGETTGISSEVNGAGRVATALSSQSGAVATVTIGASNNFGYGSNADVAAVVIVQNTLSVLNAQRLQGYYAHLGGTEALALLPVDHPFKSAAPMVPTGTTDTSSDLSLQLTARQTWSVGALAEMQTESFYGGSVPLSSDDWAYPRDWTDPEIARFKSEFVPGGGFGFYGIRLPLDGFAMRQPREVDVGTGLIKKSGYLAGVLASLADFLGNVMDEGGGVYPEHWGFPPWYKTDPNSGTSQYGYGTFWAGAAYARSVTLASIRVSDPTQWAAQIGLITDYMVEVREYIHSAGVRYRGDGFFNEAGNSANAIYGTIDFDDEPTYAEIIKRAVEKIRASSILTTWDGGPNVATFFVNSWDGVAGASSRGWSLKTDSEVLDTGNTIWQEISAVADHSITAQGNDADAVKSKTAIITANGKPFVQNEMEHFNVYLPGGGSEKTPQFRCMNLTLKSANYIKLGGAILDVPIIHFTKPVGQSDIDSNTEGYGLTQTRLLSPFGQDPSTPGDAHPTIDHGEWEEIPVNAVGVRALVDNLKMGSAIYHLDKSAATPAGQQWFGWVTPEGKEGRLVVNRTSSAAPSAHSFPASKTMQGSRYSYDAGIEDLGTVTGSRVPISLPAWSAEVWVEQ